MVEQVSGECWWMWWDRLGRAEMKNKAAGAMLLLFCENGKMKKFKKFQISKTEKNKKMIRNDSPMKGGEEVAGWPQKIWDEGKNSVQQDKVDDGVDVVVVGILGTKKEPLRGAGVTKNSMTSCRPCVVRFEKIEKLARGRFATKNGAQYVIDGSHSHGRQFYSGLRHFFLSALLLKSVEQQKEVHFCQN